MSLLIDVITEFSNELNEIINTAKKLQYSLTYVVKMLDKMKQCKLSDEERVNFAICVTEISSYVLKLNDLINSLQTMLQNVREKLRKG